MPQRPPNATPPLLIEGDFKPADPSKPIRRLVKLTVLLSGLLLLVALGFYGINVHFASQLNELGKKTREMNETNKELQVKLNRIRAFKNIETSAAKVSHLKPAQDMIEVSSEQKSVRAKQHAVMPETGGLPRVFGY